MKAKAEEMRVLVLGNMEPDSNFMLQRYPSLRHVLGGTGTFWDIFDFCGDHARAIDLERHCRRRPEACSYFSRLNLVRANGLLIERVLSLQPDVVLLHSASHYSFFLLPQTMHQLTDRGIVTVGALGDDEWQFDFNVQWLPVFDACVGYTQEECLRYQSYGDEVFHLPIGYPPRDPWSGGRFPVSAQEQDIDVLFIGRPYPPRPNILRRVAQSLGTNYNFHLYGNSEWRHHNELAPHYKGFLPAKKMPSVIARAKINLCLMEGPADEEPHMNAKIFETLMGSDCLAVATEYEVLKNQYGLTNEEDVVYYSSADDLIEKLLRHLNDREARVRIARNLRDSLEEFSYDVLYRRLFQRIRESFGDKIRSSVRVESGPYWRNRADHDELTRDDGDDEEVLLCQLADLSGSAPKARWVIVSRDGMSLDRSAIEVLAFLERNGMVRDVNLFAAAVPGNVPSYSFLPLTNAMIVSATTARGHHRLLESGFIGRLLFLAFSRSTVESFQLVLFRATSGTWYERLFATIGEFLRYCRHDRSLRAIRRFFEAAWERWTGNWPSTKI